MVKRLLIDCAIGVGLAVVGQFAQMFAGAAGQALGLPFPYESAPEDGSIPRDLLDQINLMFMLAALVMLILTLAIGWMVGVRGAGEGFQRGAVWAAVVALSQLLLSLGDGVVPVFGLVGVYVYLASIVVGPIVAGVLGRRRPPVRVGVNAPR